MKINENTFAWNGNLSKRYLTEYIILHHRAGDGDVQSIHRQHVNGNGWTGIGYHFYVRKDGSIYRGRPINTWGAHCVGYNDKSIGVCFEGDFSKEKMSDTQKKAGQKLVSYLKELYPDAKIAKHEDFNSTSCPGKNFPFKDIKNAEIDAKIELTSTNDIIWELEYRGIITNKNLWLTKCKLKSNAYWLAYKIANMTQNLPEGESHELTTINDIVWELNHRGIMTDKELWLKLLASDVNLYWLARKAANLTKNR